MNYRYLADEIVYVLDNADAEVLVFHGAMADRVAAAAARLPKLRLLVQVDDGAPLLEGATFFHDVLAQFEPAPRIERSGEDLLFLYTGGTTGMPKGVMWRHVDLWGALASTGYLAAGLEMPTTPKQVGETAALLQTAGRSPVNLCAPPLMHGTALFLAIGAFVMGGSVVLLGNRGFDANELLGLVEQHRVTQLSIVGDAFARPIVAALGGDAYDISSLQRVVSTGATLSAELKVGTKRDANLFLSRLEAEQQSGTFIDPQAGKVTLATYGEKWLANHPGLRPRTRQNYSGNLRHHILPDLGQVKIGQLTPAMVRDWHSKLTHSVLAPATVARAYRILKALFATAVADELIPRNPCNVRGASTSKSQERPIATIDQVWKLADAMHPRYKTLILLATFTGLRLGELLALRRSDIDFSGPSPYVAVRRQVFELQDGAHQFGSPKTDAGRRDVTLPPPLIPYLQAHLAEWAAPGQDGLLFQAPAGGLIRRSHFNRRVWAPAIRSVGLADFHFHDLRHTGNTPAAMTGASTRELMSRMGHASPRAALIYQHATRERDAEIAARLGVLSRVKGKFEPIPLQPPVPTKVGDLSSGGKSLVDPEKSRFSQCWQVAKTLRRNKSGPPTPDVGQLD